MSLRKVVRTPDGGSHSTPVVPRNEEETVLAYMRTLRIRREAIRRLDAEERPQIELPEMATLTERLARPQVATHWRIEDWLPTQARVMFAAQYKSGKTTAIGNLIRSLTDGDPWLDVARVVPLSGAIALIDTEMAATQLDQWLGGQQIRRADRVYVIPMRGKVGGFNLLDPTIRAHWVESLRVRRVTFLILDCLRPVLDALNLDEQHDVGRFLVAFDALLAEAGVEEAVVVHHMGHTGERARGDSRLRDWPDVEWRLVRESDDPGSPRFITAFGRDVNVPEGPLSYDAATRRLTWTGGGSRNDAKIDQAYSAISTLLTEQPGLSGRQIEALAGQGGCTRSQIRAALKRGVRTRNIRVENGQKNAQLYSLAAIDMGSLPSDAG